MPPQLQSQNRSSPRILQGDLQALSPAVRKFVESSAALCQPDSLHICDGSDEENRAILTQLEEQGMIKRLQKYDNWYVTDRLDQKEESCSSDSLSLFFSKICVPSS